MSDGFTHDMLVVFHSRERICLQAEWIRLNQAASITNLSDSEEFLFYIVSCQGWSTTGECRTTSLMPLHGAIPLPLML